MRPAVRRHRHGKVAGGTVDGAHPNRKTFPGLVELMQDRDFVAFPGVRTIGREHLDVVFILRFTTTYSSFTLFPLRSPAPVVLVTQWSYRRLPRTRPEIGLLSTT